MASGHHTETGKDTRGQKLSQRDLFKESVTPPHTPLPKATLVTCSPWGPVIQGPRPSVSTHSNDSHKGVPHPAMAELGKVLPPKPAPGCNVPSWLLGAVGEGEVAGQVVLECARG